MIIAQITDLHVVARDRLWYRKVPTNAQLAETVAHINRLEPRPDVVIASGDLTDHGREEEYEVLRQILADLVPPAFLIPGNHDRREPRASAVDVRQAAAGNANEPKRGLKRRDQRLSRDLVSRPRTFLALVAGLARVCVEPTWSAIQPALYLNENGDSGRLLV